MKKLIGFLLLTVLFLSAAQAEGLLITGEGTYRGETYQLQLLADTTGFEAVLTGAKDKTVQGVRQSDNTLLIGDGSNVALLVNTVSLKTLFLPVQQALDSEPTYEDAVYSSKYVLGQQVRLSARDVSSYALSLLSAFPFLDLQGNLRAALNSSSSTEVWATVTRYLADQRQYPNDRLLRVNVFAPGAPALFVEVRRDDFGSTFRFAQSSGKVTDWDETILRLEERTADDGMLIKGFSMVDSGFSETSTYLEADLFLSGTHYLLMMDLLTPAEDASAWTADIVVTDEDAGEKVLVCTLQGQAANRAAAPQVKYTTLVDATDGLSAEERAALGL